VTSSPLDALQAASAALAACQLALAESRAREQMALRMAAHDELTGLPNRRAFVQQSGRALHDHSLHAHVFCLLFIDLDGFKAVNDELGHASGDALLQVVGRRLTHAMRRDDFVGRLGGDEFVCLLPNLQSSAQARVLADKVVESITAPYRVGRRIVQIGASVGAALYPRHGHTLAQLLAHADEALRGAKAHKLGPPRLNAAALRPLRARSVPAPAAR
jgi:diguanylate cyclase (GGDEF)-like protein